MLKYRSSSAQLLLSKVVQYAPFDRRQIFCFHRLPGTTLLYGNLRHEKSSSRGRSFICLLVRHILSIMNNSIQETALREPRQQTMSDRIYRLLAIRYMGFEDTRARRDFKVKWPRSVLLACARSPLVAGWCSLPPGNPRYTRQRPLKWVADSA